MTMSKDLLPKVFCYMCKKCLCVYVVPHLDQQLSINERTNERKRSMQNLRHHMSGTTWIVYIVGAPAPLLYFFLVAVIKFKTVVY
jgi:hypothetical protein